MRAAWGGQPIIVSFWLLAAIILLVQIRPTVAICLRNLIFLLSVDLT